MKQRPHNLSSYSTEKTDQYTNIAFPVNYLYHDMNNKKKGSFSGYSLGHNTELKHAFVLT
jgi:hypothetical protein